MHSRETDPISLGIEIAEHIRHHLLALTDALELIRCIGDARLSTPLALAERQINAVRQLAGELDQ